MEEMDILGSEFEKIFKDIKYKFLSNQYFPKLIVGTGLSIVMGVPGMLELSQKLREHFESIDDEYLTNKWDKYKDKISKDGLEAALTNISNDDERFIEEIKQVTSKFILEKEIKIHNKILDENSSFEKLLVYLRNTVAVNKKIIDIMTPNYDRIIEIICSKIGVVSTLGFIGDLYGIFKESVLHNPRSLYDRETCIVRIFKPHGSINWIKTSDKSTIQVNDYNYLNKMNSNIEIIPPGGMKYKSGLINTIFRIHRENFNALIEGDRENFSLIIFGYGFNDQHFDSVIKNVSKNILVISRDIKKDVIDYAKQHKNWTLIYKNILGSEDKSNCSMIYEGKEIKLNKELWDLNIFVNTFIS